MDIGKPPAGWEQVSREELAEMLKVVDWKRDGWANACWYIAYNRNIALEYDDGRCFVSPHPTSEPKLR